MVRIGVLSQLVLGERPRPERLAAPQTAENVAGRQERLADVYAAAFSGLQK